MASGIEGNRSERKRQHILTSATAIFAREGFSHAGMENIARDAGVSTATLYAHFPSKAELFRIVVEGAIDGIAAQVRASADLEGDARARLTAFGLAYAKFYSDPVSRSLFRMVIAERRRFPELAHHFRERGREELGGTAVRILSSLAQDGELDLDKPSWAAGQLQGMIEHSTLMLGLIIGDDALPARPLDTIVDDCVTTFLARYAVRDKAA